MELERFLPGVAERLGCFRKGDSGLGREGLPFGLNCGLGARAPGPIDWENLSIEGVSGLKFGFSAVERLKLLKDGVVGVGGKVSEDELGEARFVARWIGRKMPAPGTEVVKYRMLSTSPSFLPLEAYSLLNSTPAKTPFFPRTLPMNLTTPCMPPGTSTASPTSMS
jgi:hypothetical protein